MASKDWQREVVESALNRMTADELIRLLSNQQIDVKDMVREYYSMDIEGLADLLQVDISEDEYNRIERADTLENMERVSEYNAVRL